MLVEARREDALVILHEHRDVVCPVLIVSDPGESSPCAGEAWGGEAFGFS